MDNFQKTITTFVTNARPIVIAVIAVALLILGVMMIYPNERSKQAAKDAIPWVVIGAAVALGAVTLADAIGGAF